MIPYAAIPQDLKNLRQWIVWRMVSRDGKKTKLPFQCNGQPADTTNSATWNTFEVCAKAAPRFSGVGFVFAGGYVGIDLDKVRDLETGETEQWARGVITDLNSYTELSQSETGWHIIVRGKLPESGNRYRRMEMYDNARYFVMTGKRASGVSHEVQARDVAELQQRMLAGLDPKPAEPVKQSIGSKAGRDESVEDFKLIASISRKLKTRNAKAIDAEIKRRFPARYVAREELKGDRNRKTHWEYNIERTLKRVSAQAQS